MNEPQTHYQVLGVAPAATAADIRAAYRARARERHPDRSADPGAQRDFARLAEAYAILSDPVKRRAYDATLRTGAEPRSEPGGAPGHYSWSNIGAPGAGRSERSAATELDEMYEAFFGGGGRD